MYQPESFVDAKVRGILCFFVLGILPHFFPFVKGFYDFFSNLLDFLLEKISSPEGLLLIRKFDIVL